jgi:outer membrane protein OmpA-like peptidoglycan-associated protein
MLPAFKKFVVTGVFLLSIFYGFSQQLIINGDFEDINVCTEYNALCSPEAWRDASPERLNSLMYGSNHFAAFIVGNSPIPNIRSYVQTRLGDRLRPGKRYKFSMDVQPNNVLVNSLGVLFSDSLVLSRVSHRIDRKADIDFTVQKGFIGTQHKHQWTHLEREFTATTDAEFITIGCFNPDEEVSHRFEKSQKKNYRNYIYLIDNVSLVPVDTQYDTALIQANKAEMYAVNERHPQPMRLFDLPIAQKTEHQKLIVSDTILLANDLLFDIDSYQPSPYLNQKLDTLIRNFKGTIDSIRISGHTDNTGSIAHNIALSLKRAEAIANYIIAHSSVTADKLRMEGKGSRFPVSDNDTPEGRYQNRRVELIINYSKISNGQKE